MFAVGPQPADGSQARPQSAAIPHAPRSTRIVSLMARFPTKWWAKSLTPSAIFTPRWEREHDCYCRQWPDKFWIELPTPREQIEGWTRTWYLCCLLTLGFIYGSSAPIPSARPKRVYFARVLCPLSESEPDLRGLPSCLLLLEWKKCRCHEWEKCWCSIVRGLRMTSITEAMPAVIPLSHSSLRTWRCR